MVNKNPIYILSKGDNIKRSITYIKLHCYKILCNFSHAPKAVNVGPPVILPDEKHNLHYHTA